MGENARRRCLDAILIAGVVFIGIILIKKLFFLILPVGLGFLFSEAVRSSFRKLKPVSPAVKRALIVLILMILFALLTLALVLAAERALKGVMALGDGMESAVSALSAWLRGVTERAGKWLSGVLHRDVKTQVADMLSGMLSDGAKRLAQRLPEWVGAMAAGLPAMVASLILFLFSSYYFSCEWDRAQRLFCRLCPGERQGAFLKKKARILESLKKLMRAYGLLFLITFTELLIGFVILGIPGAVGKALLTALVDALPVFGTGAILIPWGVLLLLKQNTFQGAGLLILYLVMWIIRQFLEPRIVGKSIGLHPVVSLILAIGGLVIFGFWGMILLPVAAACLIRSGADEGA